MSIQSPPDAIGVGIPVAARKLGVGRSSVYKLLNDGELISYKIGQRNLVLVASINRLVEKRTVGKLAA